MTFHKPVLSDIEITKALSIIEDVFRTQPTTALQITFTQSEQSQKVSSQ